MAGSAYVDLDTVQNLTAGTVPTAAWFDQVRTNQEALRNGSVGAMYASAAQSIPDTTTTAITFNSERVDNENAHPTGAGNTKWTAPYACFVVAGGRGQYDADATGNQRSLVVRLNGATKIAQQDVPPNGSLVTEVSVAVGYPVAAGDYLELCAHQDSGGALDVTAEFWVGVIGVGG